MSPATKSEATDIDPDRLYDGKPATSGFARSPSNVNDDWVHSAWQRLREAENLYGQRYRDRPAPARHGTRRRRRI